MQTETQRSHLEYEPFELRLALPGRGRAYLLSVLNSPAGQADGECHIDPRNPELIDALAALYSGNTDSRFLQDVGAFLFEETFADDALTLLRTSLGMMREAGKGLRIQLRIEAPELQALPWEYLYDPVEDTAPALSVEMPLVRYVPLRLPVRPTQSPLPLRILHVTASPIDAPPLDTEREKTLIQTALQEWTADGKVEIAVVERATVAAVNEAMRRIQPHVFHFSGHGLVNEEEAAILLEDEGGRSHAVDERTFREFFSACRETRLAVLNACDTGTLSSVAPLMGMAPRLLQRQLSAVVAMQAPIPDQAALVFAREFYRSLALGYAVDAAMAEARKGIYMELGPDDAAWGTPVLFLRARDGQLFDWVQSTATPSAVPPPAKADPVPTVGEFIGREAELAYYAQELRIHGSVVICGMAGVGKTALATVLAQQWPDPEKVFWHTFYPGDELGGVLWPLAGFLYWHQQPELWKMLQGIQTAGGQPPPTTVMFDYAVQMLRARGYLICFDNIHLLNNDPALRPLVEKLRPRFGAGELAFLATSQRVPDYFRPVEPLAGMSMADAGAFAHARGISLTQEMTQALHRHTQGNAEFLLIALDALSNAPDAAELIRHLAKVGDMRAYLLNQLDQLLTDEERDVESAVAVLGAPSTRDIIEVVLDADNLRRVLHDLTERYLLQVSQREWIREYGQHAILQDFYYDYLSRKLRHEFHRRAAEYFDFHAEQPVLAAHHYLAAGEVSTAVDRAVKRVQWAINHYQARTLIRVLDDLAEVDLGADDQIEVDLALGQLHSFAGMRTKAEMHYSRVLIEEPHDARGHRQRADAFRGLGQLYYNEDPAKARGWFEQGLEEVPACRAAKQAILEAGLQADLGWTLLRLHDLTGAENALTRALELLSPTPSSVRLDALLRLAQRHHMVFDLEQARSFIEQAALESTRLSDAWRAQIVRIYQGSISQAMCDWPSATEVYEEALSSAIGLGDLLSQTALHINIGIAQHYLGNRDPALHHLQSAIELAQRDGLESFELKAQLQLARLHTQIDNWADAEEHLDAAETLIQSLATPEATSYAPLVQGARAQLYLAMDRKAEALNAAQAAVAEATAQEKEVDLAICQRILAETLLAHGRSGEAAELAREALAHLGARNPYETAKTKALLGLAHFSGGKLETLQTEHGHRELAEAKITLTRLGAKLDLAALEG